MTSLEPESVQCKGMEKVHVGSQASSCKIYAQFASDTVTLVLCGLLHVFISVHLSDPHFVRLL